MTVNKRIFEVRKSQTPKMTMEVFGNRLGVGKGAISAIESGKRNPSDQLIKSICREFNVNETWLRTGEGQMLIKKSRSQEIEEFMDGLLEGDDNFKRQLVSVLSRLDDNQWAVIERVAWSLVDEMNSGKAGSASDLADLTARVEALEQDALETTPANTSA